MCIMNDLKQFRRLKYTHFLHKINEAMTIRSLEPDWCWWCPVERKPAGTGKLSARSWCFVRGTCRGIWSHSENLQKEHPEPGLLTWSWHRETSQQESLASSGPQWRSRQQLLLLAFSSGPGKVLSPQKPITWQQRLHSQPRQNLVRMAH